MESIFDRYLTCCYISNHFRNEERVELWTCFFVFSIVGNFLFESLNTTDANTKDNSNAVFVYRIQVNLAISYSLFGCYHSKLSIWIHLASLFTVHIFTYIQPLYFATEVGFALGCVKMSNRSCSANTSNKVIPHFFWCITDRSNCS